MHLDFVPSMPTFAITLAGLVLLDIGIIRTILQHPPRVWSNSMGAVNSMGKSGVGDQARGEILVKDCALTELLEIYKPCPRVRLLVRSVQVQHDLLLIFLKPVSHCRRRCHEHWCQVLCHGRLHNRYLRR
jgi:hypothetical protein